MKDLRDKVAVVTGAASGIGRALAERFAGDGMKLVLADIEPAALAETEGALRATGATVLAVPTDVSKGEQVDALAKKTIDAFGAVHVVCNNAGVALSGLTWEMTTADWEWILGVNLWGVIHGVRAFVPLLLQHGGEGHVVNTASVAGLVSSPGMSCYNVTKHGVVTLSETLYRELRLAGAKVGVSVLCPGWVNTRILDSDRNRPAHLPARQTTPRPEQAMIEQMIRAQIAGGTDPAEIARLVHGAILEERFYVLPHTDWKARVQTRLEDILTEGSPDMSGFAGMEAVAQGRK